MPASLKVLVAKSWGSGVSFVLVEEARIQQFPLNEYVSTEMTKLF